MSKVGGSITSEFYSAEFMNDVPSAMTASDMVIHGEGHHRPKLKCRVGEFSSNFSAILQNMSQEVKLADKKLKTGVVLYNKFHELWSQPFFILVIYKNFERLHRHLKDIPNYTLHLPPKRIFSSSAEDAFVHQRCIQLDKYLQDLLTIDNVADQHKVWDFLNASSKVHIP
ncbi:hypothetical protein FXO38_00292 [Capsicum annuum]|nr:hypothetical protein FXO37_10719 [Capsicum annuum]KAF3684448.1 hypothetical protein FXO38_00292 [Capsicum annuum]